MKNFKIGSNKSKSKFIKNTWWSSDWLFCE